MKKCRTIDGLLKAIDKGEACCLSYTSKAPTRDGYIIYQTNGTNLLVTDKTYQTIEPYLRFVKW